MIPVLKEMTNFREMITDIDKRILNMPGILTPENPDTHKICPLKHMFVDGAYVRELTMPKGMIFSTKIHKVTHAYFLLKGKCSVLTEKGIERIKAPFSGITRAGTKRLIYTHEDTVWATVHVTDKTDVEEIEKDIIAKTFNDVPDSVIDINSEVVENFIKEIRGEK